MGDAGLSEMGIVMAPGDRVMRFSEVCGSLTAETAVRNN